MEADEQIDLNRLLSCLVRCSERAAEIARVFRAEGALFQLLVEEKSAREKNKKLVRDFKTLADVLVQVSVKKAIEQEFPSLSSKIQGEEQNSFQNALGESIKVELTDSREATVQLLGQVLDGNTDFAERVATVVHSEDDDGCNNESSSCTFPADKIGIWIDPIDSTSEYIQTQCADSTKFGIAQFGLKTVCVLIGAYDLESGIPIIGVVNQPFHSQDKENKYSSKTYWGLIHGDDCKTSIPLSQNSPRKKRIVTSSSEDQTLQDIMKQKYEVIHTAGAGYKSLLVSCADADLYVLSQGTTYFWDTCGPQAILASQGGGILDFRASVKEPDLDVSRLPSLEVKYSSFSDGDSVSAFQNSRGIIAYRKPVDVLEFLEYIRYEGFQVQ